ncbi:NRDE family protein [soil metagenome]
MCTVTFIPVREGYVITSNRDEKFSRKQAIPPVSYVENEILIICPKDADAGGTWIAMRENGDASVLLNGAFEKHISQPPYAKSRGIIFLDIFTHVTPLPYFMQMNLQGIEPFTMIIFNGSLNECRWDGNNKHCRYLRKDQPYIWSSATLYENAVVRNREQWFATFLSKNPHPSREEIFSFHQFAGDGDVKNDLLMNRNGLLSTVSITAVTLKKNRCKMHYVDLKDNKAYTEEILLFSSLQQNGTF